MKQKVFNSGANMTMSSQNSSSDSAILLEKSGQRNSKKDSKELKQEWHRIRMEHLKEIRDLKTSFKKELELLRKRFDEQVRNERENQKKMYEKQNIEFQRGQETIAKNHLREVIQNYEALASTYRNELERIKQIQHEHDAEMRKKDSEIIQLKLELSKASSDFQAKKMISRLAERNVLVERLRSRIGELELLISQRLEHEPESQVESACDHPTVDDYSDDEEKHQVEGTYLAK